MGRPNGVWARVPVTRWLLSTAEVPLGYEIARPSVTIDARSYPEFPKGVGSWKYLKIDIC
jgi:hypothetical protein